MDDKRATRMVGSQANLPQLRQTLPQPVMIGNDDRTRFGSLVKYSGSKYAPHGVITEYDGEPEIVVRDLQVK